MYMNNELLKLIDVSKTYKKGNVETQALRHFNYSFSGGKLYAIVGHSGSGKSTLLQICGLLNKKSNGNLYIFNNDVDKLSDDQKCSYRNLGIGFMFQEFYLDDYLSSIDNVMLPYYIGFKSKDYKEKQEKIKVMFNEFGLSGKESSKPSELSTGQNARVSFMRSLVNDPDLILADEPTGNLDKNNEDIIFKMLRHQADEGKCVIVVSHSDEIKKYADTVIRIENGEIVNE